MSTSLNKEFFAGDTLTIAKSLIGVKLIYNGCEGIIVETEAYRDDAASHAVTRPRYGTMLRDTYGKVYIYFIYGMYHCLNFTTEKNGVGAVLIRALQPVAGLEQMHKRRQVKAKKNLTNGPGKLFQAFGFDPAQHGENVGESIHLESCYVQTNIVCGPRIGISKAKDLPWRFCLKNSPYLSKPA